MGDSRAYEQKRRKKPQPRAYMLWNNARQRARRSGNAFSLELADIERRVTYGRCEATGLPFSFENIGHRKNNPWAPSLDQHSPSGGYTPKNTRVVVWIYNSCKHSYSDAEVETFCRAFLNNRRPERHDEPDPSR